MTVQTNLCDHPEPVDPPREEVETREVLLAAMDESGYPATVEETDAKLTELLMERRRTTLLARWNDLADRIEKLLEHRSGLTA